MSDPFRQAQERISRVITMPVTQQAITSDDIGDIIWLKTSRPEWGHALVAARLSAPEFDRCTALRVHPLLARKQTMQRYEALLFNQICDPDFGCSQFRYVGTRSCSQNRVLPEDRHVDSFGNMQMHVKRIDGRRL